MTDEASKTVAPLEWVGEHLALVPKGGRLLDVACGGGRHLRAALAHGLQVTGIDRDLSGVDDLAGRADVHLVERDLEAGVGLGLGGVRFEGVVVANYLWRPLLAEIVAAVSDDGVLIYETFAEGNARFGRPARPDFLLRPDELLDVVRGRLIVLAYRHGVVQLPRPAVRQGIVAIGPRHRAFEALSV